MSVRISTDAWHHSQHGPIELLVLLKLADNADEETRLAWPSVEYLAKNCRVSKRRIQYALRRLEESGEIVVVEKATRHKTPRYRIDVGCTPESRGADHDTPESRGADHDTLGVQTVAPEPSVETSSSSSSSSDVRAKKEEELHVAPDDVSTIWQCYVETMKPRRTEIDHEARSVIRQALRVATVDECRNAILGCAASPFHMGRNDRNRKYNKLSQILKGKRGGKTTREQIDMFIEVFTQNGNPGGTSSSGHVRIQQAKRQVLRAFDLAGGGEVQEIGDEAKRFLAEQGIEVCVGDDGRPAFSE